MSLYATPSPGTLPRHRSKKRRLMREHALKAIKIIGNIPAPLAPELPPSPPASRSPSPAPPAIPTASSSKRKLDAYAEPPEGAKRPRVTKPHSSPASDLPSGTAAASSAGSPPVVASSSSSSAASRQVDKPSVSSATAAVSSVGDAPLRSLTVYDPVRRPRHGIEQLDFRQMHKKFYAEARAFKYSGEARFLSTYPQNHSMYRPLRDPPAKGSPYHTHGGLMALLEVLEALMDFVYAAWCQDHISNAFNESWEAIPDYLNWCKSKWQSYVGSRDNVRERSFIGLIHMIEAFTYQRIVRFKLGPHLDYKTKAYMHEYEVSKKAKQAAVDASTAKMRAAPPEKSLPSPDTDAASANSTPANLSNGTPPISNDTRVEEAKRNTSKLPPSRPPHTNGSDELVSVKLSYLEVAGRMLGAQSTSSQEMKKSEKALSLAIMREHFPHTFGRVVYSSLSADEEYEPDMEDGEGELFWPSQCVTGEGIAWVCLMGRAMVREFGKDIGYTSFAGIIPKPGGTASS